MWVSLDDIGNYPFPKANKTLIEVLYSMKNGDLTRFLEKS